MLGLHNGVVLINDLLPDNVDPVKELDIDRLYRRVGGAGGIRLTPPVATVFFAGVLGSEMEVTGSVCCDIFSVLDEELDSNSS